MTTEPEPPTVHEARRAEIAAEVPGWYSPAVHLAIPTAIGVGVAIAAAFALRHVTWADALALPVTLFAGFGLEWRAHKFVLHHRTPGLGILYERHELKHHVIYTYDDMAMRSPRELYLILMPAYAIVLVFLLVVPFALATAWLASTNAALFVVIASMLFFLSYEWMHMSYHLPEGSLIGRSRVVARLRELHRRHHDPRLMKHWNFNVTVPVFDAIHRTRWSPEREAERRARQRARRVAEEHAT
ncbi:MAG TPA: hypothetical protein VHB21_06350 [Minicystis sp.]|nr:hypothetical protein [Minicystis sp.]